MQKKCKFQLKSTLARAKMAMKTKMRKCDREEGVRSKKTCDLNKINKGKVLKCKKKSKTVDRKVLWRGRESRRRICTFLDFMTFNATH